MKEFARDPAYTRSLVEAVASPDQTQDYGPNTGRIARRRLRAVAPVRSQELPTTTIGVGSREIIEESLGESPRERSIDHRDRVVHATFTSEISLKPTPAQRYAKNPLTTDDFIQVSLATIRESTSHCFWPSDVIATFLAADVLKPGH